MKKIYRLLFGFSSLFATNDTPSWTWPLEDAAFSLGYTAFNDPFEIGTFLTLLKKNYHLDVAVVIGTNFGGAAHYFSLSYEHVHTIEVSENLYTIAKERLRDRPNIQCHLGESTKILRDLLPSLQNKRLLFYFDLQVRGCESYPPFDELEEISKTHRNNCIILIDDFKVPNTRILPRQISHSPKFVAIPKKWQKKSANYAGRIDVLPGLNFWDDVRTRLLNVKAAGFDIQIVNQFFNGNDKGNYVEQISGDHDLKRIVVINNTVDPAYLFQFPKEKLVLFLFEPLLLPFSYFDPCSRIYTWNDDLVDGVKFFKLYYPYLSPMISNIPSFEAKKLCVMISGSDNAYPERKNELYSERMKWVDFFEAKPAGEFDIYGRYWVKRYYRDFRGSIPGHYSGNEKLGVLKNYRFAVCFENTKDLRGYITEKIFDCFAAGCVPIYWGASNVKNYIPKGCFIDFRDFRDREEVYQYIKSMPKHVYEKYIENIRAFLNSEEGLLFSPEHFEEIFYEAVTQEKA